MILPPDFISSEVDRIAEQRSGPRPHGWTTRTELMPEIKGVVSRCDTLSPPQFSSGWVRALQASRCNCRLLGFKPRGGPRCPWCHQVREFLWNHVCRPLLPLLSSATHCSPLRPRPTATCCIPEATLLPPLLQWSVCRLAVCPSDWALPMFSMSLGIISIVFISS